MKNLETTIHHNSNTKKTHVLVSGKLCAMDAMEFKNSLLRFCRQSPSDIKIDLREVEEADLTGVNSLAIVFNNLQQLKHRLSILTKEKSALMTLLHSTKLHRVLPIAYS